MNSSIYENRRFRLMDDVKGPAIACIFSGKAPMRSADETYSFSVDRSFYYLTGIDRENMVLVLQKDHNGMVRESIYIEPYDELLAKWVGGRMKEAEVTAVSGIRTVDSLENLPALVGNFMELYRGMGRVRVYLDLWRYEQDQTDTQAHRFAAWIQKKYPAVKINELYGTLAAMRSVKSKEELEKIETAIDMTKNAIVATLQYAEPGMNETEIEGAFDFSLMRQGCREHAFPTICAAGKRATTLHYCDNNCVAEDGQLIQLDLGAACDHYCADISRAFPVNGTFTDRQKEIYNTVLEAQRIVIEKAMPGMTMSDLNKLVMDYYETRLDDLRLRKNGRGVRDYYYHSVTHSLGLDCHDVCTLRERTLKAGMVITDEPGLYIEEEGIGIRIEDDILITDQGAVVLSKDIPKTVEEIEAIMAAAK